MTTDIKSPTISDNGAGNSANDTIGLKDNGLATFLCEFNCGS